MKPIHVEYVYQLEYAWCCLSWKGTCWACGTLFHTHSDGDKLVPSVQKKINELEVGLLHLQQNIDIPEISLPIHPTIQTVVKKAGDGSRKPTVEDLSGSLGDTTFLNALQKDVSRWIREIQKVRATCRYMWLHVAIPVQWCDMCFLTLEGRS